VLQHNSQSHANALDDGYAGAHYLGAIEAYSRAIALDPTNAVYFANRAAAHIKSEQYGSAIADAGEAIKLNPKYIKAWLPYVSLCHACYGDVFLTV
jgi:tetratricopeptide (TPR) repeat protein